MPEKYSEYLEFEGKVKKEDIDFQLEDPIIGGCTEGEEKAKRRTKNHPFKCDDCDYSTISQKRLDNHGLAAHEGIVRYECSESP